MMLKNKSFNGPVSVLFIVGKLPALQSTHILVQTSLNLCKNLHGIY